MGALNFGFGIRIADLKESHPVSRSGCHPSLSKEGSLIELIFYGLGLIHPGTVVNLSFNSQSMVNRPVPSRSDIDPKGGGADPDTIPGVDKIEYYFVGKYSPADLIRSKIFHPEKLPIIHDRKQLAGPVKIAAQLGGNYLFFRQGMEFLCEP